MAPGVPRPHTPEGRRGRRRLSLALRALSIAAGVGATIWVAARVGASAQDLLAIPARAHLVAGGLVAVEVLSRALRIWVLARGVGVPLAFRTAVRAQLAADAAGAVTPSKVASDPTKLWVMGAQGGSLGGRGGVLLGEMLYESAFLLMVAGTLLVATPVAAAIPAAILSYVAVVLLLGGLAVWGASWAGGDPPWWWTRLRLSPARWQGLRRQGGHFLVYSKRLKAMSVPGVLAASAATLTHMAARILVLVGLLVAWVGVPEEGLMELVLWPFGLLYLGSLLPPPGGGGILELSFAAALGNTLSDTVLPAALLWWRMYTYYLPAALGGLVLMTERRPALDAQDAAAASASDHAQRA